MSRPIELVYSTQKHGFIEGRAYANPRFYTTPRSNISKVFLVGEACPNGAKIRVDYEALGVKVEVVDSAGVTAPATPSRAAAVAPATLTPSVPETTRDKVFIPDNWEELSWTPKPDEDLSLRALAAMVSDTPVINKAQAKAAIIAELERRKALAAPAQPEPPPPVEPGPSAEGEGGKAEEGPAEGAGAEGAAAEGAAATTDAAA